MALTNDVKMPSDEELTVPQEITLSTPWLKAVAVYMSRNCEDYVKEFMLLRKEAEDPRVTLKQGAKVTACGIDFLKKMKKTCLAEVTDYANCIDTSHQSLYVNKCREQQRYLDKCVEEKLHIKRPPMGYFSKLHVHDSDVPPPEIKERDYKAEAAKHMDELPRDYLIRKDYRRYEDFKINFMDKSG